MIHPYIPTLLRRTAAALAAIAGVLVAADSQAAQITLTSGTASCSYQSMSVTPAGDFTVNCTTASAPVAGNGGTFALSSNTLSLQVGTTSTSLVVTRSGGTTDAVSVPYSITSGGSCTVVSSTLNFPNGSSASVPIPVTATGVTGSCVVTISAPTTVGTATASPAPTTVTPNIANVTVTAAPPPPPPGSCPTPPTDMVVGNFDVQGTLTTVTMVSRQIGSFALPDASPLGRSSGTMKIGETTGTVAGSFLEVTISKCPGVIDTTAGGCYGGTYTQNYTELSWFHTLGPYTLGAIQSRGYCYAPRLEPTTGALQTWYLNFRWTYNYSAWGFGRYVFTWGNGPY